MKSRNLRHETQNSEWEIRQVCPIRSSLILHHISRLLTTNWLQPLIERKKTASTADKLRPLRPLRPLRRSGRPIIVVLSGAQRSRRISLKSRPLVAASRDHSNYSSLPSNYPQTTLKLPSNYPPLLPPLLSSLRPARRSNQAHKNERGSNGASLHSIRASHRSLSPYSRFILSIRA